MPTLSKLAFADRLALLSAIFRITLTLGILLLLYVYQDDVVTRVLPHLAKIDLGPVSFDLSAQREHTRQAANGLRAFEAKDMLIPDSVLTRLSARAARDSAVVGGRRILWLDDNHPINNTFTRLLLNSLGVFVDPVATKGEASTLLHLTCYDLLIVDGRRYPDSLVYRRTPADTIYRDPLGGLTYADSLARHGLLQPILVYSQHLPPGFPFDSLIAGIAFTPTQLADMTLDQLTRHPNPVCGHSAPGAT